MGVRAGFGVGTGEVDGAAGGLSGGVAGSSTFFFLPVVALFCEVRRGIGALRGCAIELPSLLKKSPTGLPATAESPLAKKRNYGQDQDSSLKQATHECCHFALRRAVFNISRAFPGRDAALRRPDSAARRPYPLKVWILLSLGRMIFRLALIHRFKHFHRRRVS